MANDARFGLPLSLLEALRADPSADAALLADLLAAQEPPAPPTCRPRRTRLWRTALAGLTLATGVGTQGYAAQPSLQGQWTMAAQQSSFQEEVTGPAPDAATMIVTRDDPGHLVYQLIESRHGAEVAHATYDISFAGAASTSRVDGLDLAVTAVRDAAGDVVIRAPAIDGMQATIRVRRTGSNTALLEHDVEGPSGALAVERISLVRTDVIASN